MDYKDLKVLVVDDSEFFRNQIRGQLQSLEILKKDDASNAEEAIEKIENYQFDLILMDMVMPNTNGIQLIKKIRKNSSIPIIAISTLDVDQVKIQAIEAGANDFISKPLDPDQLKESLVNISETL